MIVTAIREAISSGMLKMHKILMETVQYCLLFRKNFPDFKNPAYSPNLMTTSYSSINLFHLDSMIRKLVLRNFVCAYIRTNERGQGYFIVTNVSYSDGARLNDMELEILALSQLKSAK